VPAFALACLVAAGSAAGQDGAARKDRGPKGETWDQDQYEEKVVQRAVERAVKVADSDGHRWQRELAKAFPGKVGPGLTEEDHAKWFGLLAGGERDWRRAAAPTRQVAELFDRVAGRLELGPIPSVRRDEFLGFARRHLLPGKQPQQQKPEDRYADADRLFRVLDRDGSGSLETAEWTEHLRTDAKKADADGNRKVSGDEFRAYFEGRVAVAAEVALKATAAVQKAAPGSPGPGGLPGWFKDLDTDGDGQVGLYEWRTAGKPITEFLGMDLDGDGLLPPEEYHRYVKQHEAEDRRADAAKPSPDAPPDRQMTEMKRRP
jgi:hypothetical protein